MLRCWTAVNAIRRVAPGIGVNSVYR